MRPAVVASLDPKGPAARSIADLWWLMLVVGTVVFAVVAVLLVVGLFRRRDTAEPAGDLASSIPPAAPTSARFDRWLVGGGVILPVVVLSVVLGASVWALRDVSSKAPRGALVVEVIGHQWWWEVRYPEEGVVTANEVHIPVGRAVAFELTSADVIHSFWVPELGGKLDALPDGVNTLVLEADEPGEYRSECAEFCGLQHAQMALVVVAHAAEQFDSWIADRQRSPAAPANETIRRGQDVFGAQCAECHTVSGTSADGTAGPDLTHVASRPTIGAGAAPMTANDLAAWVTDPHTIKEGVAMPPADLDDDDLAAVLAYLETLR